MKTRRNDSCWCGSGKKYKYCHMEMDERLAELKAEGYLVPRRKLLKTEAQIAKIRESAAINTALLDYVADHIQEGMTTEEIDRLVYEFTTAHGAIPAPLNFQGFPKSVCTSVNQVVCHGIPSEKEVLKSGDILNVDVSTNLNGYYSDASRMFLIGEVSPQAKALVQAAEESIQVGLDALKPWGLMGDMGHAIHTFIKKKGYSVVQDIGGHGIGLEFHEDPYVSYVSEEGTGMVLAPGLIFTIEPMINQGHSEILIDERDGWTVRTADGKLSAQWESMVLMTETGPEVLSR